VAWALLELWSLRRVDWLRELAEDALRYEDRVFDDALGNWPDLRHYSTWMSARQLPPSCQTVWCHGAGGIALARIRAYELTREPSHLASAQTAIRALARGTSEMNEVDEDSLSLCHGLAGNLGILSIAATRLPDSSFEADLGGLRDRLAAGVRQVLSTQTGARSELGLMLGLAGSAMSLMTSRGPWQGVPLLPSPL
jgi:lantibiotic modifying enzyme